MGSLKLFPSRLLVVLSARCPGTAAVAVGAPRALQGLLWAGPRLPVSGAEQRHARAAPCLAPRCCWDARPGLPPVISPTAPNAVGVCSAHLSDRAASLTAAGSKVQIFTWNSAMLISPHGITGRAPPCDLMS